MRTSCIRLRPKSRIAVLYEDFLEICAGNMLAAMLLAILVYWTDVKIRQKDSNLWIWKSHTDFQEDLMFDKPGMKPPHRVTIKAALDLLVEKKFVYRRKNPKLALDQTKQYLVDQQAVQAAIDALPPIVVKTTLESRNSDNGMSEIGQSLSKNRQCNVEIPTSNTSDYNTVITDSEITDSEEDTGAIAPPARDFPFYRGIPLTYEDALTYLKAHGGVPERMDAVELMVLARKMWMKEHEAEHHALQEKISDTAARLKAIGRTEQTAPDGWQASPIADEEIDPEATVKVPAIRVTPAQPVRGASEPSPSHSTDGAATSALLSPSGNGPRASGAGDGPPPTLTRKQQDKLIEKTFAAYWAVIEAWKGHKYSQAQRGQACHTSGLESMFADGVAPETLKAKLKLLDDFQKRTFNMNRLYLEWWNNLDEQAKSVQNGNRSTPAPQQESRPRRRHFDDEVYA